MTPAESLVLSLFPGIGLLDMAFEEEGFCVVRGPDLLWGGDVRRFHPPAGKFDGVIGGPPCQEFSELRRLVAFNGHASRFGNMIPEFERVVAESGAAWFLMENVPKAPDPNVSGLAVERFRLNNRWVGGAIGADQNRLRHFWFGSTHGLRIQPRIEYATFESPGYHPAIKSDPRPPRQECRRGECQHPNCSYVIPAIPPTVTSSDGGRGVKMVRYRLPDACKLQGLPEDFLDAAPFTAAGKLSVVASGVPLPMGRAIARAVKAALHA